MPLPKNLLERLTDEIEHIDVKSLEKASHCLSERYKQQKWRLNPTEKLAYAICRMPATYAVLERLNINYPTILDLGAGPGTASFATSTVTTSIEHDPAFIKLSQKLGAQGDWIKGDFRKTPLTPHHAVLFSYSLGEVWPISLKRYWEVAQEALIIIEPGTPRGYETILEARDQLIALGGHVAAPCPHNHPCPLIRPDWCHFGVNLPRTPLHRRLKQGRLGFEEEKFAYLIVTRAPASPTPRLLMPPEKHSGHLRLKLCTESGLEMRTLSKRDGPLYKSARKATWGDSIALDP